MLYSASDRELWDAAMLGSREAFGQVFRLYYPLLHQYGRKICPDAEVLEDCIQELFIDIWQKKNAAPVRSVKAYLLQALKFKLYKAFHAHQRMLELEQNAAEPFELSHEAFLIGSQEDEKKAKRVLEAVNQLPPRQKEVLYLKIYKGLTYEEVSEVMQINYQTVRNLLCQALKTFRKLVACQP